jgi:hypothetical protein
MMSRENPVTWRADNHNLPPKTYLVKEQVRQHDYWVASLASTDCGNLTETSGTARPAFHIL